MSGSVQKEHINLHKVIMTSVTDEGNNSTHRGRKDGGIEKDRVEC